MISKELLSEVLGTDLTSLGKVSLEDAQLCLWDTLNDSPYMVWNIHELAHKCKEWAFNKMLFLSSGFDTDGAFCLDRMNVKSFIADTEPEAIFKACQWILDNKDK